MPSPAGSIRLFSFARIRVFVHWSWFVAAYVLFDIAGGRGVGDLLAFLAVYCSLFGIVILHEFGHALACRSVGGEAKDIVLWPLGGVAFVKPPPRPGAVLWSIAAGPLVNVALAPILYGLYFLIYGTLGLPPSPSPIQGFLYLIAHINLALLVFNMLPIYPLDGGQILQSILWFFVGRARSLRITAGFGLAIGVAAFLLALVGLSGFIPINRTMLLLLSAFVVWQAWSGYRVAHLMSQAEAREQAPLDRAMDRAKAMGEPYRDRWPPRP
ncbi:MAG: M50 family metallopeptidase [Planctomycetota bacterium]